MKKPGFSEPPAEGTAQEIVPDKLGHIPKHPLRCFPSEVTGRRHMTEAGNIWPSVAIKYRGVRPHLAWIP